MGKITNIDFKRKLKQYSFVMNGQPLPEWAKITFTKINGKRTYIKGIVEHGNEVELFF